jgi:hypothetical protein
MEQEINTLELAKLYEKQGYIVEAQKMYDVLNSQNPTAETAAGLERMNGRLENKPMTDPDSDRKTGIPDPEPAVNPSERELSADLKKWMTLVLMENRLARAKQAKRNCRPEQPELFKY